MGRCGPAVHACSGVLLPELTLSPRSQLLIDRVEAWAHCGRMRSIVVKLGVTVAGPLIILAGVAMLVLPGPGLVVMALGLALMAVEYPWARTLLLLMGRAFSLARQAVLPRNASPVRRLFGVAMAGAFLVATFAITTSVTAYVGASTFL